MSPKTTETPKSTPARATRSRPKRSITLPQSTPTATATAATETPTTSKSTAAATSRRSTARKKQTTRSRDFSPLATRGERKKRETPVKEKKAVVTRVGRRSSRKEETVVEEVKDVLVVGSKVGGTGNAVVVPPGGENAAKVTSKDEKEAPSTPSKEADTSTPISTPNTKTRAARRSTRNTPAKADADLPTVKEDSGLTTLMEKEQAPANKADGEDEGKEKSQRKSRRKTAAATPKAKLLARKQIDDDTPKPTEDNTTTVDDTKSSDVDVKEPVPASPKATTTATGKTPRSTRAKPEVPKTPATTNEKKTRRRRKSDAKPNVEEGTAPTVTEEDKSAFESGVEKVSSTGAQPELPKTPATTNEKKTRRRRKSDAKPDIEKGTTPTVTEEDKSASKSSVGKDSSTGAQLELPKTPATTNEKKTRRRRKSDAKPKDVAGTAPTLTEEEKPDPKPEVEVAKKDTTTTANTQSSETEGTVPTNSTRAKPVKKMKAETKPRVDKPEVVSKDAQSTTTATDNTSEATNNGQPNSKKRRRRKNKKIIESACSTTTTSTEDATAITSETTSNGPSKKRRKRKRKPTVSKDCQEEEVSGRPLPEQQSPESTNTKKVTVSQGGKRRRKKKAIAPPSSPEPKLLKNKSEPAPEASPQPPAQLGTFVHRFRHARHIPRAIIRLAATPCPSSSKDSTALMAPYLAVSREGGSVELVSVNEKWKCVGMVEGLRGRNVDAMAWVCGRGGQQDDTDQVDVGKPTDVGHFCVEHRMAEEVHSNRTLIGASSDGTIFEVDFSSKRHKMVTGSGGGSVFCLTALDGGSQSPSCGGLFAAGCEDGSVRIFDMVPGDDDRGRRRAIELVCALPSVGSPILSIAWRRTITNGDIGGGMIGTTLYAGVADGTIRKFECTSSSNGMNRKKDHYNWKATTRITVESHGRTTPTKIWSLLTLTDGTLVSGDSTGRIQFWDGLSSTLLQSFEHNNVNADVLDLAVSSDESKVMACGVDSKVVYIERQQKVDHQTTAASAGVVAVKDVTRKWVMTVQRRLQTNDVKSLAVVFMTDTKGAAGYDTSEQLTNELLCSGGIDTRVFSYPTENLAQERPKLVYKYPQIAPLRLAKKARILGIMRCDRVDLFRMANKKLNGRHQRVGLDEDKTFLGSIIIQGAHNLIVMDLSDDGKFLAVSDASSLYLFSLDLVKNQSTKTGSDEVIVPTLINISSPASTPSSALKFVPDDSQRLICATINGTVKVLKIHNDDDDNNNDQSKKDKPAPNPRVTVEHTFDELNNTTVTNLNPLQSTSTYNFPITEIAISPDSTYLATGRNTMSTGSVQILTISPTYKYHYVVPCTEAPYSCLSFLGGDDEGVGGETASNSSALAMGCNNGSFYVFDVERKCISDWSTDLGIPASKHLPTELNLQPDGPVRFACNPTTPNKFLMGGQNWFCAVDLDSPIPVHSTFSPSDHLSAIVRKAEAERSKQIRRRKRLKGGALPDPSNLTICLHYTGIIFMDFLSKDELVVVEQPWVGILDSLPDALERKRYGS